ncbi:MAG: hypothetical protein ACYCT0_03080 [Sulfobacillus sp.]
MFRVPGQVVAPTLIGPFGYADFAASATYSATMVGVLDRNAKARSFAIENTLDEAIAEQVIWLFDSTLHTYTNSGSGQRLADANGTAINAYA